MSDYIVWLDSAKAHVFELNAESTASEVKKTDLAHAMKNIKGSHEHHANDVLFKQITEKTLGCKKLLLMGPGLAKNQFQKYLDDHYTHTLATKVVGVETCDHPTDNQVLAIARKFFVHYDLFNDPVLASKSRE
ncbi:MAG: hypothetical protein B7Y39_01480 [Bdellovibrio sp. 28-41-41]|nr:MAG: hypothetical protein B7Y39_01480 [Bdellovibrio sp. 28-41-41]